MTRSDTVVLNDFERWLKEVIVAQQRKNTEHVADDLPRMAYHVGMARLSAFQHCQDTLAALKLTPGIMQNEEQEVVR